MGKSAFFLFIFLFVIVGCGREILSQKSTHGEVTGIHTDFEYCTYNSRDQKLIMSYPDALIIARNSECIKAGKLLDNHFCNNVTGTWWIDLEVAASNCSPACVVDIRDGSAQINWRCGGAVF